MHSRQLTEYSFAGDGPGTHHTLIMKCLQSRHPKSPWPARVHDDFGCRPFLGRLGQAILWFCTHFELVTPHSIFICRFTSHSSLRCKALSKASHKALTKNPHSGKIQVFGKRIQHTQHTHIQYVEFC